MRKPFKRLFMNNLKQIRSALVSVYHKDNLDKVVLKLNELGVKLFSTGGTKDFIEQLNVPVASVESLTGYPSILGGRVKTLHPGVFGGILARRENATDLQQLTEFNIPEIDLVIVDLYPFQDTVKTTNVEQSIIEKIDIGGISLIRAAAKNFKDVVIIASRNQYTDLLDCLENNQGKTSLEERRAFATEAFQVSSDYDTAIYRWFAGDTSMNVFKHSVGDKSKLRYGENPHQQAVFFGNFSEMFEQLAGKDVSYNNLLDIDAAVNLIAEFNETSFAILKHTNACGVASRSTVLESWNAALAGDPVSAFGGVLITNATIDNATALAMNAIFFEVVIAPAYEPDALTVLMQKKSRIILIQKKKEVQPKLFRSLLNGILMQERDTLAEQKEQMKPVTVKMPTEQEFEDLIFANKIVKHTKSNAIVLAKNKQLCAGGVGQTSRVDALKQAIEKAKNFNFDLNGAVLASDAFFPFADSVEIAHNAGVTAIVQPGGSIRDNDSVEFCDKAQISMVFTGIRHFKH